MNDQRLASLIGEWLTARGLHRTAETLKAEGVSLTATATRSPPTELDTLLSKLSKGDTYYKPPPNIFVKPRPRDIKRLFRMVPLPELKDEWQDDDDAGFRKISGRDAELAFQHDVATPVPVTVVPVPGSPVVVAVEAPKEPLEGATANHTTENSSATPNASAPPSAAPVVEDESIPRHYVEANLPPTPDGSATVNPAAVVDEDPFERFDLKIIHAKRKTGFEESKDFPIKLNSIIAGRYQILEYIGSAAFSKAVQCLDMSTGELVCIKIIKNNKDFFDQSLDEIKLLKYINAHAEPDAKNVVQLYDYFYFKEHLFIVCELLRDNLYEFYKYNRESGDEPYFTLQRLQKITRQCLVALDYVHGLGLIHCDLKPENILIKSYSRCEVKVIDFGSSCFTTDHLSSYVQSRSYRAPEVLLGLPYGQKIDLWSLGCILAELWTGNVLFLNDSIVTLLARIVGIIGPFPKEMLQAGRYVQKYFTPEGRLYERDDEKGTGLFYLLPKRTNLRNRLHTEDKFFVDFIRCLLRLNPEERPTAAEALEHPFLRDATYEGNARKQQQ